MLRSENDTTGLGRQPSLTAARRKTARQSSDGDPLFYERFARQFDSRMNRYEVSKRLRLIFDDVLSGEDLGGQSLLDAGCGTGLFSAAAVARGAAVTSMDLGENLLAQVAKKCESQRVVGSVLDVPFPDSTFDVVLSTEVIEHSPDPRRAIAELARVTALGGRLVVTTPNRLWRPAIRAATKLRLRPYEGVENWIRWNDLRRWLTDEGVRVVRFEGFNAVPFVHPIIYPLNDWLDGYGRSAAGRFMINMLAVAVKPQ